MVAALTAAFLTASCGTSNSDAELSSSEAGPSFRRVTLPVGTVLHLLLTSSVASDTSQVEDVIKADLTQPVIINGQNVVPTSAHVSGRVTAANDSDRVKGRAQVSLAFTALHIGSTQYEMQTSGMSQTAPATKSEDAAKIGVGAGVGAAVGAILGGKKGAAEGAAIGGGVGTGVVLTTSGPEVRLAAGTEMTTRLIAPLIVRVAN